MNPLALTLAIIALGFLIAIHELGHMLVAKWCGMRCLRYSIGFGPVLFRRTWGETTYQLGAIPFGGFVEIDGMNPYEEHEDPDDPRLYENRPIWMRMAVIVAGPLTNYLFAFLFAMLLFGALGQPKHMYPLKLDRVTKNQPADKAGLKKDDLITHVDGRPVRHMFHLKDMVNLRVKLGYRHHPDADKRRELVNLSLEVIRGTQTQWITHRVGAAKGSLGVTLAERPKGKGLLVKAVVVKPKAGEGLQKDDVVLAARNGAHRLALTAVSQAETHGALGAMGYRYVGKKNTTLTLTLRRGKGVLQRDVDPDAKTGLIGVGFQDRITWVRKGFGANVLEGARYPVTWTVGTLEGLGKMLGGDKEVASRAQGPVGIVVQMEKSFKSGADEALLMVIVLSVLLGLFNILPVPALDGGRLVFLFVQAVARRKINPNVEARIHFVGFIVLLGLIFLLTYRDVKGCFG